MLVRLLAAILIGGAAGLGSALWSAGLTPLSVGVGLTTVNVDEWRSDWSIGSTAANPHVRARIARHGLLALTRDEAVYFTRNVDDEGLRLQEACIYRLTGGTFPAQWWSITLYDRESRLPMNEGLALSVDQTDVGAAQDWSAVISDAALADHALFLSSRNAGQFDLMLRLYRPDAALLDEPQATLKPPRIERLSCREGDA